MDRRPAHLRAARQDAGRLELDQRPHLQSRPAPGFRQLGAARQPRLGLCRRAALLQAAGAARRRGRRHLPRPRRQPHRHRPSTGAIRSARPSSRARSASASRATPTTTARSRRASPTPSAPSRTAGASARRRAFLHPAMKRPNLARAHARARHRDRARGQARGRRALSQGRPRRHADRGARAARR